MLGGELKTEALNAISGAYFDGKLIDQMTREEHLEVIGRLVLREQNKIREDAELRCSFLKWSRKERH